VISRSPPQLEFRSPDSQWLSQQFLRQSYEHSLLSRLIFLLQKLCASPDNIDPNNVLEVCWYLEIEKARHRSVNAWRLHSLAKHYPWTSINSIWLLNLFPISWFMLASDLPWSSYQFNSQQLFGWNCFVQSHSIISWTNIFAHLSFRMTSIENTF
jgi:hypothetical protein